MKSMKVVRVVTRLFGLLGLAGVLVVSAMAGAGPVPDPNGLGGKISQSSSQ